MTILTAYDFLKDWTPKKPLDHPALKTGFRVIDERIAGLRPGNIYIVAGRPSMGVSTALRSITINVLRQGANVLCCTSGRPIEPEVVRLLSNITGRVDVDDIEWNTLNDEQRSLLDRAKTELSDYYLSFSREKSFSALLEDCKTFLSNNHSKLPLIVIDNPIFLDAENSSDESIGRSLSKLAYDHQVPIVLAAGALPRADRKTLHESRLADIKGAFDILDFADAILFLRREEVYNLDTEDRGVVEIKIVKNNGRLTGSCQKSIFFESTSKVQDREVFEDNR
ncbi:hypothetical protein ETQ85_20530 [Zoogloea oleivorans]|uniref:SF4 helicase domain-containing protein n=2 Tax=Zoogloea oleivorans TaxID=1552750 RepID=A0A6C2CLG3_9RHOO|nr:hypothetical protein ETQ85_20530 [Zoogloea oleivorans]